MLSWKRTISFGMIMILLASAVIVISGTEAGPTRASPTLSNPSLYPITGYTDTTFNFSVKYTDTDNDAPMYVAVAINNYYYNMTEIKGGNGTYATGRTFFYTTYLSAGNNSYYFETQNVKREFAVLPSTGAYYVTVQSRTTGPQLYNQSYTPTRPTDQDTIIFNVMYKHSNGTAPSYVNLNISKGGLYNVYNMSKNGQNYTAGVVFNRSIKLDAGYYFYHYEAMDSNSTTVRLPISNQYTLYVSKNSTNTAPTLTGGGHNPKNPAKGNNMTFWVTYTDDNGDAPIGVWLNFYAQNDYYNQTTANMTVGSGNVTMGVNCSVWATAPPNGTYYYYFETWDIHGAKATTSTYTFQVGTSPPLTPYLTLGVHSPSDPTTNDTVLFTVYYRDPRGSTLPDNVYLVIRPINGTYVNYTMTGGHSNASKQIPYTHSLKLANDTYHYHFMLVIGGYSYTYPSSGYLWIWVKASGTPSKDPYLSNGDHSPDRPTVNDTINFTVTYTDPIGIRTPHYVQVYLTNEDVNTLVPTVYNMTKGSGDLLNGTTYYYTASLMAANYSYYFHAIVGNYSTSYPSGYSIALTVTNGSAPPPKDNSPVLSSGAHSPTRPTSGSNVTFTVTYTDRDGDAPSFVKLHINEIVSSRPYKVYNMTWTGVSYVYGVRAQYILSMTTGNYSYYFTTSSKKFNVTYPAGGKFFNLTVVARSLPPPQKDNAPTLSKSGMAPSSPTANSTIYFSIVYKDADNDAPNSVKFHLLGGLGSNYANYSMNVPRGTYSNGVTCTYTISLLAGTYYYYFTASSTNYTVSYPTKSTYSFNVSKASSPPPNNRSGIGARTKIVYTDGSVTMDVTEKEEGFTISLSDSGEDFVEIEVSSQSGEDRVIEMVLDPEMFDISSPDDLVVKVDGKEVSYTYVADPSDWNGDEPAYYIRYTEDGAILYVLLPEADTHTITAKVPDDVSSENTDIWYYLIALLVILIIIVAVVISLLTSMQKRKMNEYYDDFDTGMRDGRISSGKIIDEDDIEWEDLIEAE